MAPINDPFINDEEQPFDLLSPENQSSCVVYSSPHSGLIYPRAFQDASALDNVALRRSEDAFVDELYEHAPAVGSPLLKARFPRAYVDPNREPWELDPEMFTGPLPSYANTSSPRVRSGLGTIARVVTDGATIYKNKIDFEIAKQRIEKCYMPFHGELGNLLEETYKKFGTYLLVDCHSMPSIGGPMDADPGNNRVDMVLGDANGAACAKIVSQTAREILEGMGYRVVMNRPYAGGFTTRNYGRPYEMRHALQIEINRALYMNEDSISKNAGFETLKNNIAKMVSELSAINPALLRGGKLHSTSQKTPEISIRNCEVGDMSAIQRIYANYVENSFASFEELPPSTEEMTGRREIILQKNHPYIVAEINGAVVGFAYATTFRPRSAYRHTVENSIYVDPEATGKGVGSMLMQDLINICGKMGFRQMIAVIGDTENNASIGLHEKLGFVRAGVLRATGFKFGRWVNTVIMQRGLDGGEDTAT